MYDNKSRLDTFILKKDYNYLELELENGEDASDEWLFGIFLNKTIYFVVDEEKKEITPEEVIKAIDSLNELLEKLEK